MPNQTHSPDAVAIIGAGPAGIVAARWLVAQGLEPTIFEASTHFGGQWNPSAPSSGTWSGMRTNTSRVMTAFSDLDHPEDSPTYPTQGDMLRYLERYVAKFDLGGKIRLATPVDRLERVPEGWLIRSTSGGVQSAEIFPRVIVASGRHSSAEVPDIPGLTTFTGAFGTQHSAQYQGAEAFRGRSVVVAGCSISALEIAADLAYGGAATVTASYRRQRYILPKLITGVPTDHVMFTRAAALLGEIAPPEALAEGLKATVLRASGNPAQFGAPRPDDNIFAAGISQSQNFLPAVAEGRIKPRPWITEVRGRTVHFADGTSAEADAILFGTGYRMRMPWLSPDIAATVGLDGRGLDLHAFTLHPDLPGLAFLGLYDLVGPYFPVLELQARWIARTFAGPALPEAVLREGVAQARSMRAGPPSIPMHVLALLFARLAGVEPDLAHFPELERALLFGPLAPISFRLTGPDRLADARPRVLAAAAEFGAISGPDWTAEQRGPRDMIRGTASSAAA